MTLALLCLFTPRAYAQTPVALSPVPAQQFLSNAGVPLASGCIYTFITGTSTPLATYTDGTGVTQSPNPVILDAGGFASGVNGTGGLWLSNSVYRFQIWSFGSGAVGSNCGNGTLQRTVDSVSAYTIINQAQNIFLSCAASDPSGTAGELACRSDLNKIRAFTTFWDSVVEETVAATLTNKTLSNPAFTGTATGLVATSPTLNSPNINGTVMPGAPATYLVMANNVTTGTMLNKLAKIDPTGLAGFALLAATTDTGGITGIVVAGAGNTGNATIQQSGSASCIFDNAVTAGDYAQISSTVAGDCHDAGATYPLTGQILGRLLATNASAGTYLMDLFSPEIKPVPQNPVSAVNLTVQAANIASTPILTPAANGFYRASCYLVVTQAATISSTLPNCNITFTDADSGVAESQVVMAGNTANTLGALSLNPAAQTMTNWFYAKSGVAISYFTAAYASSGATPMQYAIHIRLEGPF